MKKDNNTEMFPGNIRWFDMKMGRGEVRLKNGRYYKLAGYNVFDIEMVDIIPDEQPCRVLILGGEIQLCIIN